jgi:hypothetical protein
VVIRKRQLGKARCEGAVRGCEGRAGCEEGVRARARSGEGGRGWASEGLEVVRIALRVRRHCRRLAALPGQALLATGPACSGAQSQAPTAWCCQPM